MSINTKNGLDSKILNNEIFGKQPNKLSLTPDVNEILAQFGERAGRIIEKVSTPEQRKIIDKRLSLLEAQINLKEEDHRYRMFSILNGIHYPDNYTNQEKKLAA